jgi:nicotinate-nucleotide adenylyltransferase
MERLGIFGGTFDPPHLAHLVLAGEACRQLSLDRVLWVLTPDPPHKDNPDITPYSIRRQMLQAAIVANQAFELCEVESERPGPHYMVDTVRILQELNPDNEWFLLLGEDSLRDLPTWHSPRQLLRLCPLVVMRRPGAAADLAALEMALPGITGRVRFIDSPLLDISSTDIRARARRGEDIHPFVPNPVREIIQRERRYVRRED